MAASGHGVAEVGGVALLPGRAAAELVLDEQCGGGVEDGEGFQLGGKASGVRGQRFQDVLEQDEAVGAEHGPGDEQGRQPRVTPHDRACLLADGEEVGEPVAGRRREDILRTRGVDHQVEQVLPGIDVAVQGRRAGPELGGEPPHRDRVQAFPVGDRDSGGSDLLAGALGRAPGGRVLRAHPDDVPGFLRCHSASRCLALRTSRFATSRFANAALRERRALRTPYPNYYPTLRTPFAKGWRDDGGSRDGGDPLRTQRRGADRVRGSWRCWGRAAPADHGPGGVEILVAAEPSQ